ncbi:MAG: DUF2939 domain-containing protein [Cyanobacteria bacterium SZAS TMP-1]|nr:DUF2939 domain-containing protein [Cyanobacteria bacterium SZAS TMP-1]
MSSEKKKKSSGIGRLAIGALLLALAAWIYWSPYETLHEIRRDLHEGQTDKLDQMIDYTAVREGLKRDFRSLAIGEVEEGASIKNKLLGVLGLALGEHLVDPVVDYVVSPSGLREVVNGVVPVLSRGGDSGEANSDSGNAAPSGQHSDPDSSSDKVKSTDGKYIDFNLFVFTIASKGGSSTALTFTRHGLMTWQLTHIRLMPEHQAQGNGN